MVSCCDLNLGPPKFSKTANLSTETPFSAPADEAPCDGAVEICLPSGRTCVFWSDSCVLFSTVCRRNRPASYVFTQWEKIVTVRCCTTAPVLDNLDVARVTCWFTAFMEDVSISFLLTVALVLMLQQSCL